MSAINDLILQIQDTALRDRIQKEVDKLAKQKKFGLVFEEHLPESTLLYDMPIKKGCNVILKNNKEDTFVYSVLKIENEIATCIQRDNPEEIRFLNLSEIVRVAEFGESIYPYLKPIDCVKNDPNNELWHVLIESDNYHALQLLEYLYAGKVDCIYIDPPYNTGAKDWKYNNDYVDTSDSYRHSKWLSFIEKRLVIAKKLLNPKDSVLIVTIDEKEYLHLGCLLEEMFPEAKIQMITDVINPGGTNREKEFSRVEEYLFICRFGSSTVTKHNDNMLGNTDEVNKSRVWYSFCRGNNLRHNHNRQFFPIYIDVKTKKIMEVGDAGSLDMKIEDFPKKEGMEAVFPINSNGEEASWRGIPSTIREWVNKGYVKVSNFDKKNNRWTFAYIPSGLQERIESGDIVVNGKKEDGSLNIENIDPSMELVSPRTVWLKKNHNATDYGASLIKQILPGRNFPYPKSLYSVADALRFFVKEKKDALIVDFFAGSGTTLHAVNLLNAEDGGKRKCILVTNNEVSEAEAKMLRKKGLSPVDDEWVNLGIARHITWPRTLCTIKGFDIKGMPLKGNYIGSNRAWSDGFKANAAFMKLSFLDNTAVSLGMCFSEIIPMLWLKTGAYGECPSVSNNITDMLILPQNKMAILNNESAFSKFKACLEQHPEIQTVYLATDYEVNYRSMVKNLNVTTTYQLYRDYLDHFRINNGRS